MNETEYAKLNIIEGSDKVNYAIINENTSKIEAELMRKAIRNTVTGTTAAVTATGPWYAVTNSTAEDISVTINGEAVPVSAESTVKVDIENIENDFEISLSSETDVTLTYFVTVKSYVDSHGGGGGGGTSNYNDLSNRPSINNITLAGNKTAADLGLVAAATGKGLSTNDFTADYKKQLDDLPGALNDKANSADIGAVNGIASLGSDGKVPSSQLPDPASQKEYRIAEEASTSYAKVYKLQQKSGETWADITDSSAINIPKDMVVESGSVKECTTDNVPVSGYKKGDKYIDLVIANKADAHIYINVKDLINNEASGIKYSNSESRLTATNVQGAIDEIARTLKNTIESPNVGEVGQVLTIRTVDSSGKPTEWEYTTKSGGGEGGTTNYNDLSNKPAIDGNTLTKDSTANALGLAKTSDIPTVPANLSAFNNDVGYTTFDGNYNSLSNKPEIPSVEGLYSKPEGGIPASDMSQGVQESLGKADTALQEHQSLEGYVKTTDSRLTDARASNDVQAYAKTGSGITVEKSVPSNALFTDTTYSSKTASSGGTDVSLVTTGEKYTWNNKVTAPQTATVGEILAVKAVDSSGKPTEWKTIANTASGTSIKVGSSGTTYSPINGVVTIPAYPTSLPADGGTAANVSGTVAIANGGTGATTAANAKTNLGLGNVGNFKAVSTVANQGLTTTEKSSARTNLGLGDAATKSAISSVSSSSTNLPTSAAVASAISTLKSGIDDEYGNHSVDITNAIITETTRSDSLFSGTPTVTYAGLIYNKNEVYINIRVRGTIRSAMKTKNYGSIFRLSNVNLQGLISSYASVLGVGYQIGNTNVQVISSLDSEGKLFIVTPQGTIGELQDDNNISVSLTYLR